MLIDCRNCPAETAYVDVRGTTMQDLPHRYMVAATALGDSNVKLASAGLETLDSAAPAEFGGPGDLWSPETLLVAAVADCFVLSFRAIARASRLDWTAIRCDVEAILDRVEGKNRFTAITERVVLDVPEGTSETKAMRLLEKAELACLVTNSMTADVHLDAQVTVGTISAEGRARADKSS